MLNSRAPVTRAVRGIVAFVGNLTDKLMRYQVIFQFPETFFATHEDLIEFENKLVESLPKTCDVDGYDTGSGTVAPVTGDTCHP